MQSAKQTIWKKKSALQLDLDRFTMSKLKNTIDNKTYRKCHNHHLAREGCWLCFVLAGVRYPIVPNSIMSVHPAKAAHVAVGPNYGTLVHITQINTEEQPFLSKSAPSAPPISSEFWGYWLWTTIRIGNNR